MRISGRYKIGLNYWQYYSHWWEEIANRYTRENIDDKMPFWRVLRSGNLVIKSKNFEQWAAVLEDEGFSLDYSKAGKVKVAVDPDQLFEF